MAMSADNRVAGNGSADHAKGGCYLVNRIVRRRFTLTDGEGFSDLIRITGRDHAIGIATRAKFAMRRIASIEPIDATLRAKTIGGKSTTGREAMTA